MKVVSIVGVRPQFIKLFSVSKALRKRHNEIIVHTGQHYDFKMSDVFLQELGLPIPDYNLNVGSGSHATQTSQIIMKLEQILLQELPDTVIVFGDTNSTLAAALTAVKLKIPLVHIEAGLRSYNRDMPEEINRIATDHISNLLFCPTKAAQDNLKKEGIVHHVHRVGDVMFDAALSFSEKIDDSFFQNLQISKGDYLLLTIHRESNTNSAENLGQILKALEAIDETIVFPIHPRTRNALKKWNFKVSDNVKVIEAVGYTEMLALEKHARMILTDSGGVQKEAYFFSVPCVTLRSDTEWMELVTAGWNRLVGVDIDLIVSTVKEWVPASHKINLFGDGDAGSEIVSIMETYQN